VIHPGLDPDERKRLLHPFNEAKAQDLMDELYAALDAFLAAGFLPYVGAGERKPSIPGYGT
jgi:hypothetical protein